MKVILLPFNSLVLMLYISEVNIVLYGPLHCISYGCVLYFLYDLMKMQSANLLQSNKIRLINLYRCTEGILQITLQDVK